MGGWGVFLGLRIFFLKIFHPKIKSVQNGLKCKKTHKKISLLNNYSLRPVRNATAWARSNWIISAQAVHCLAWADTHRTSPALRRSVTSLSQNKFFFRNANREPSPSKVEPTGTVWRLTADSSSEIRQTVPRQ